MAAYGADNTSITNETVYELELLYPVELSEIDIVVNYSVFRTGAEFKWQGYNGSTWVDVTGTLTETQATNTTITYTLNSTGTKYYSYRLQGISGATWYNRIYEIVPRVDTATYQSSLHPKDNCSVDTDGDGTYNHLDTDSDGDACIDTIEAGTSNDGTTTDANNNGLLDQYEDGTTGTINYTSTYSSYAINDAINACADTDGDGVNDVFDLDDDNDGVLDTVESYNPNSTVYTVNIQTDNTWKKSTVENATEGGSFNGVSFGDIPNSATFTEDVTIGNPANGTITGVDKIVAPLNKQTYYRKTFTLTDISNFNEAIIAASRDNSCQIFINGNDVARTNGTTGVNAIFGLKINESGANQNGYNHTAFETFTTNNANDIFVEGENEIIFVLDDSGGSAGLSLDLDVSYYQTIFIDTDGDGILKQSRPRLRR